MMQVINFDYELGGVPKVREGSCDLIFADPPYNQGIKYADDSSSDTMDDDDFHYMLFSSVMAADYLAKKTAYLWWICPERQEKSATHILTKQYGPQVHRIIWHEKFSQYNRFGLTRDYRFLLCHRKHNCTPKKPNYDAIRIPSQRMIMRDKRAIGPRIPGMVWDFRRLQGTSKDRVKWHPCQICPELLERIILGWSNKGDKVCDLFAGSGSMGLVATEHGRDFIGIDKSPTYCTKMVERINEQIKIKEMRG